MGKAHHVVQHGPIDLNGQNFQLNFIDFLLTDLELQTEIEDSNRGAEMFVMAIFWKATSKGDKRDAQTTIVGIIVIANNRDGRLSRDNLIA